jgi:ferredoxin-NADP reductase
MLRTMADTGDQRHLTFFYGNPGWENITFREELESLEQRLDLKVVHVLEDPPENWGGETGFISAEVMARHIRDCATCIYFICGPVPMLDFVTSELVKLGVPSRNVRTGMQELFGSGGRVYVEQYEMA